MARRLRWCGPAHSQTDYLSYSYKMTAVPLDRLQNLALRYSSCLLGFLGRVARRKVLSCVLAGGLAMAVRIALLPLVPLPDPSVSDEYANLLGADTFASGRLTNPPHPMWVHFETFHENLQPTYASKYPPAQAGFLAFGQKFLGHPWFGVWISFGLMCACLCWMLQGWMPPLYALLGTLAGMGQIGIFGYWMNSYMGGAVTAMGGCLVLGALPRLARRPGASAAVLGSLGLVVLANSRPYEGSIISLAAGVALLWWRRRLGRAISGLFTPRTLVPLAAICGLAACGMAYYNHRVTGNALLMPYTVNQRMYSASPHFWVLPAVPIPEYRHEVIRQFWVEWDRVLYLQVRANPLRAAIGFLRTVPQFYTSTLTIFLILTAACVTRSPKVRMALALVAVMALGLIMEKGVGPHYFAPATGLVFVLVMYGARWLFWKDRRAGPPLGVLFVAVVFGQGLYGALDAREDAITVHPRRQITRTLDEKGGRHLVIVRYAPVRSLPGPEFVYNRADIDGSPIVWARDMGAQQNRELIDYYHDRRVWLLQPDLKPMSLTPYPDGAGDGAAR
jgi:hypothetical protein